jgi:CheY-like chemotaxis protein
MDSLGTTSLEGRRILVVEDNYFIAQDVCRVLRDCGAEIVGPVGRAEQGLRLAEDTAGLDGAVLDFNLDGESAVEIARALRSRRIGFVIVSGYDSGGIPEEFADAPRLVKPVDNAELQRMVEKHSAGHGGH